MDNVCADKFDDMDKFLKNHKSPPNQTQVHLPAVWTFLLCSHLRPAFGPRRLNLEVWTLASWKKKLPPTPTRPPSVLGKTWLVLNHSWSCWAHTAAVSKAYRKGSFSFSSSLRKIFNFFVLGCKTTKAYEGAHRPSGRPRMCHRNRTGDWNPSCTENSCGFPGEFHPNLKSLHKIERVGILCAPPVRRAIPRRQGQTESSEEITGRDPSETPNRTWSDLNPMCARSKVYRDPAASIPGVISHLQISRVNRSG